MVLENATNETRLALTSTTTFLLTTFEALIFVISITGNSLIIAVVVNNVNMRTTMNLFVVNMAASYLVYSFFIAVHMANSILGRWPFDHNCIVGLVLCKILLTSSFLSGGVSTGSLVAIAVDRFGAVFFLTKRPLLTRRPLITLTIIWVLYSALASPLLIVTKLFGKEDTVVCRMVQGIVFRKYLFWLFTIFYAGLPTIAILVIYPAILIRLWKRKLPGNPSTANQEIRGRTNRKVTYMAVALMLAFVVSSFPYLGLLMKNVTARHYMVQSSWESLFALIALVLAMSSCAWNPLICIIFNNNFRKGFKEILRPCFCCCCKVSEYCFNRIRIVNLTAHVIQPAIELADMSVIRMAALEG